MAFKSPSQDGLLDLENAVQQSMLQQAQAATGAQTEAAGLHIMRQQANLPMADLLDPDPTEANPPPPAYGDIYGEICDEKNGLGSSARVTDDGRVNIRINQLNRRLSQIFTPALYQQVQSAEDSQPPPGTSIPPSPRDQQGAPPPPLNIVIQVVGSRGDVQPFVTLGKVLKDTYGHRIRLATHSDFRDFVQEHGLEFFSIGGDPSQLMAFMVKNRRLMPDFRSLLSGDINQRRRDVAEYIQGCWRSCYEAGDGMRLHPVNDGLFDSAARSFVADCIIANPPSFAHIHCAEKLGIPLHIMFTMPYSPTKAFPHPLANIQSSNADPQLTNYMSYAMIELLTWQALGDIINRFRAKCLGLDPIRPMWGSGVLQRLKIPHTYCWSPTLMPKPKDWGSHISVPGFFFLDSASTYSPTPELKAFLDAGPPPVYVGFGSIVLDDPDAMTELVFEAVRNTGQRVLLSQGWGGLSADRLHIPDGVFLLGNVPHDWLFKHVSCVVHHGGAGTTAAGITTGKPTVIVPFFGDQPFWGSIVARAGAGPRPIPYKQLTSDKLADAINFCLKPESLERARALASKITVERGGDMGAQAFHQHLEADRLRCNLAPSRPAVWRLKRTKVRLSAFAACTLANAKLLDFHDLKLFRAQEYYTDEGPLDPVSGGFMACLRTVRGFATGLAEFPSETIKPLQYIPTRSSRQQSHESVSTIGRETITSDVRQRPMPLTSSEQSQTSLYVQQSLTRVRAPPNLSRLSSNSSNIGSNSASDELQGQLSSQPDNAGRRQAHSSTDPSVGKDRDMLRPTGVHVSKGLGRILRVAVQAPMEVSMGLTKGFHNVPKLWGDDTVRPQHQISDFKSGATAAGKEFGFGWYDGFTGLVTQPWKGAQKEGVSGFVKGFGKGIGGFVTKPLAGCSGILGHTMKGVHKEVQKLFGGNVQNYIVASRVAQGYEEWLKSSDAEKEEVIVRWKLIQKHLKEKSNPEELVDHILERQRQSALEDVGAHQTCEHTASSSASTSTNVLALDPKSHLLNVDGASTHEEQLPAGEIDETALLSIHQRDPEEDAGTDRVIRRTVSQLQRQRQEAAEHEAEQEELHRAMAASEKEAQRHASDARDYKRQLKRVMAQSLREQRQMGRNREWEWDTGLGNEDVDVVDRSSDIFQRPYSHAPGSLMGVRQNEFRAQQERRQQKEETTQEKSEEEIVMEYVKKQSLLEARHRKKGKAITTAIDLEDKDEDL